MNTEKLEKQLRDTFEQARTAEEASLINVGKARGIQAVINDIMPVLLGLVPEEDSETSEDAVLSQEEFQKLVEESNVANPVEE